MMFATKITRRTMDPITFVERVSAQCVPRLEDTLLDDQLGASMSYTPPKRKSDSLSESKQPLEASRYRSPTPPKERGESNSPRDLSLSPFARQKLAKIRRSSGISGHKKKPNIGGLLSVSLSQIGENEVADDESLTDLSLTLKTSMRLEKAPKQVVKCVRFSDEVDLNYFSRMRNSVIAEIFWTSDDLANFRYEAFMEKAGLDLAEYD